MQKDALEFLRKQALDAEPKYFAPSCEPSDTYYLKGADGYRRVEAEPKPRSYRAAAIEDLVEMVRALRAAGKRPVAERILEAAADAGAKIEPCVEYTAGPTLIMVGQSAVTALINEHHRRERVTFPLTMTSAFKTLLKAEQARDAKTQRDFVSLLRVDLNDCVPKDIVNTFRSLKFQINTEGESSITNSNKAVSKSVQMKLVGGGQEIPDEISVEVAVYEEFPESKSTVRCAVETCIEEATFTLIPLAGELSRVNREERTTIARALGISLEQEIADGWVMIHCGEVCC